MGLLNSLKKHNCKRRCSIHILQCDRCKKRIIGLPTQYMYASNVGGRVCDTLCEKCAATMSFCIKYITRQDNGVFNFALISDKMLKIHVMLEKDDRGVVVTKEIHNQTDNSITKRQKTINEPRNLLEVLWGIQHLCGEFKLDFETLKYNKGLLNFVFSSDDPNIYKPRIFGPGVNPYSLKSLSKIDKIKIGTSFCTCSISEQPLRIKINDKSYTYSIIEGVQLPHNYDFIEHVKINSDEFFLYYVEHPSRNYTLGWSIYTLSAAMYDHMKFGGKNDDLKCALLGHVGIPDAVQCIPYVIAAISNNMKIHTKNGETWCK